MGFGLLYPRKVCLNKGTFPVKKFTLATRLMPTVLVLMTVIVIGMGAGRSAAQTATETPAPTTVGPSNSSQGTLFVCADSAILDFTGTSLIGFDVFYQIFSGTTGSGTALTNQRQVPVAGEYAVSDQVTYNSGVTVAAGGQASAKVDIARESDPTVIDFSYTLVDTQDGCGSPTNTLVTSTDTGSTTSTSTTSGVAGVGTNILAPNGGILNPNLSAEPDVVIGARLSDRFRSETPGLIFAECDAFPLAEPGIIYDSDTVTIFWSWFTKTQEQMDQHLANALYSVKLNTADLPMTTRSEPVVRNGTVWVFYTANVGNLAGTANPRNSGLCNFDVLPNPDGTSIAHNGMYIPTNLPTHDIILDD
jgi:hypothetical protein